MAHVSYMYYPVLAEQIFRTVNDSIPFCKLLSCTNSKVLLKLNSQAFGFCSWDFHCFTGSSFNGLFLRNLPSILRSTFIERSI